MLTKGRIDTPWGVSDDAGEKKADGIVFYSTPSHGGYLLSESRFQAVRDRFPEFLSHVGGVWFEEDQDWAIVALTFPEYFSDQSLHNAVRTVDTSIRVSAELAACPQMRGWTDHGWSSVKAWIESSDAVAQGLRDRVGAFQKSIANMWERGGCAGGSDLPRHIWTVFFRRGSEHREVNMPYPEKQFYTDEELTAFETELAVA